MNPDLRPGGEFHTMPSSRLHNPVNARLKMADSAVLREKTIFSPRNASVSEWTLSRILKIKISRDTKQLFRKPSLPRMRRLLSLLFSTILFFLLSFSRPPRGMSDLKSPSHFIDFSAWEIVWHKPWSRVSRCDSTSEPFSSWKSALSALPDWTTLSPD